MVVLEEYYLFFGSGRQYCIDLGIGVFYELGSIFSFEVSIIIDGLVGLGGFGQVWCILYSSD